MRKATGQNSQGWAESQDRVGIGDYRLDRSWPAVSKDSCLMIIIRVILWNSTDVNVWGTPAIERPLKRHTMGGFPHNLEVLHGQLTRLSQVHWFKGLLCLKSKWRMATLQAGWTKWDYDPASRFQPQGRPPPTASEENFYQVQSFFHSPNPQKDHNAFFSGFFRWLHFVVFKKVSGFLRLFSSSSHQPATHPLCK